MIYTVSNNSLLSKWQKTFAIIALFTGCATTFFFSGNNSPKPLNNCGFFMVREGYDAKTGKWISKKPSPAAFSISPDVYEQVKNWYSTDSGTNNPNNLPVMAPKEGYAYIYTPYKDAAHPNVHGMSIQGQNGFKGYWYADNLSKATDSSDANGEAVPIPPPKILDPPVEWGGYDARTGNWIHTQASTEAFPITQGTYLRVKNWFITNFNTDNPLGLTVEVPKEDYTYLFVPYKDPKHPGIIGMSFQGDVSCKGYWYADKIGESKDTVMTGSPTNNAPPVNNNPSPTQTQPVDLRQQQQAPPPSQNQPVNIQQQSVPPPTQNPPNNTQENGTQPKK